MVIPKPFAHHEDRFRKALSDAIRRSHKSRAQIADGLSTLVGTRVSVRMLNNFTSDCRSNYRFPAAWIAPLCEVLGDDPDVREFFAREMLTPRQRFFYELGVACAQKETLLAQILADQDRSKR